ncbi:MAG: thioredoxin family protein [Deltaproteobacteria bacterium]|nr:thioredoxin family protein [Deltaproteobacteria bacterium]
MRVFAAGRHLSGSQRVAGNSELQLFRSAFQLSHYFSDDLSASIDLPIALIRFREAGQVAQYISGIGDLSLSGRFRLSRLWQRRLAAGPRVDLDLGLGLPSGAAQATAPAATATVSPHLLTIGLGTFSLQPRVGVSQHLWRYLSLFGDLSLVLPLSRSPGGVNYGLSLGYSLGLAAQYRRYLFAARLAARYQDRANELGMGQLLNSGGHWLDGQLEATAHFGRVALSLGGRLPLFASVDGTQLTQSFSLFAAVSIRFGEPNKSKRSRQGNSPTSLPAGAATVRHETAAAPTGTPIAQRKGTTPAPPTQPQTGFVRDLARGGQSFSLAKIRPGGRVAVIDFWAEWCAPCKVIDKMLRRLAKTEPLAVYRVEVPSFDAPVAQAYLSGVNQLPAIWIYNRRGKHVVRQAGVAPADVERAVRDVLSDK